MAETNGLLNRRTSQGYRGFESPSLRRKAFVNVKASKFVLGLFDFRAVISTSEEMDQSGFPISAACRWINFNKFHL